jgi:hypothetical protein
MELASYVAMLILTNIFFLVREIAMIVELNEEKNEDPMKVRIYQNQYSIRILIHIR